MQNILPISQSGSTAMGYVCSLNQHQTGDTSTNYFGNQKKH